MKRQYEGAAVSIVRPGGHRDDGAEIRIVIRVAMGKTITATMTPEDLALALTGMSDVPCDLRTRNLEIRED